MFRRVLLLLTALAGLAGAAGRTAAAPPPPGTGPATPRRAAPDGVTLDEGEIDGARFAIARAASWNGYLLLIAHGYRDQSAPLVADLNPRQLAHQTLLAEGWMIAKTSYRRNGLVIRDAIADLENLRAYIAKTYGEPQLAILEGDSMGGAVVTLMAEQFHDHFQGAVAVGAALQAREPGGSLAFNLQPQIPLVFLTNQSELDGPRHYLAAPFDRPIRPFLFEVKRDGHVNVSQRERLVAIRALLTLIDGQPVALPGIDGAPGWFDATQQPAPGPSQVRLLNDGGFEARVSEVTAIFGNVILNAQPMDLAQAAIAPGTWFELAAKGQTYRVCYGRDFTDVPRGQWVAFPDADGFLTVGRNRESAAATASLREGDPVVIHRVIDDPGSDAPPSSPP
jgi:pimeloyl-ACP methyl ester carboxylesterase